MLLNVKNIFKDYARGKIFSAVNNVSFSLKKNDFACIMGKSGSGKKTLLNIIAGITTPTKGKVIIDNQDIFSFDDKKLSLFRNQEIGYVPQGSSLLSSLNVLENICLPYYINHKQIMHKKSQFINKQNCKNIALEFLNSVGLVHLNEMYPRDLSGGETRRIAVLRSLICSPKLIIADEPTNDLDEESAEQMMKLLTKINDQGTTILIVTHDKNVANYANSHYKMICGKLC